MGGKQISVYVSDELYRFFPLLKKWLSEKRLFERKKHWKKFLPNHYATEPGVITVALRLLISEMLNDLKSRGVDLKQMNL